jgi:tetratricopeptide (TPR) repeat protein
MRRRVLRARLKQKMISWRWRHNSARFARSLEAKNDLLALEARNGGRTAATAQLMGVYLIQLQLYHDALDALEEGVKLAPRSFTLRINAGYTAFKIGALGKAREHLEVAMDMRPNYIKPLHNFVWVLIGQGAYDEAIARLETAPLDPTDTNAYQRRLHQFSVEVYRALNQRNQGQTDLSQASLERAEEYLAAAAAIQKVEVNASTVIFNGLRSDDGEAVFIGLCALYQQDPGDTWILKALLETMPTDLSAEASALVQDVLKSFYSPQLQAE